MLINKKFEVQTLTENPTGNSRCHVLASRALNMSCSFGQSARSIESRCVGMVINIRIGSLPKIICTLSHPDDLVPDRISSRWLMSDALYHLNDLAGVGILSGWFMASKVHYVIRMTYPSILCHPNDEVAISSGWVTAILLCHPDDIRFHS